MLQATPRTWDEEVDLLVIGGGTGGMTAALVGALEGLKTVLCEKTSMVGGTTSTSGGTTWVPGTSQSVKAGVPDLSTMPGAFWAAVIGPRGGDEQRAAFLEAGPTVIDYLEARSDVTFIPAQAHPDYIGNQPGAAYGGRALGPAPFDGRKLGEDFERVRPPRPEFLVLGGMMITRADIPFLLAPFRSVKAFTHVARMITRHIADRLRYKRGTNLVMGNALVARLLYSLRKQNVPILFETALSELVAEGGTVIGAILSGPQGQKALRARKGVVLATGGIAWNQELRTRLFPEPTRRYGLAPETNTGDGVATALRAGAALDDKLDSPGLWMPCSVLQRTDGTTSVFPHIILDRSKPGLIAVNSAGRRFVNESELVPRLCHGHAALEQNGPECSGASDLRPQLHPGLRDRAGASRNAQSGAVHQGRIPDPGRHTARVGPEDRRRPDRVRANDREP